MGYTAIKSLRQVLDQSLRGCTKVMGGQIKKPKCGRVLDPPELWVGSVIFLSPGMENFFGLFENFFLLYYVVFDADSKKLNMI